MTQSDFALVTTKPTVLIITDRQRVGDLALDQLLDQAGCQCMFVDSPAAARALLEHTPISVIMIDTWSEAALDSADERMTTRPAMQPLVVPISSPQPRDQLSETTDTDRPAPIMAPDQVAVQLKGWLRQRRQSAPTYGPGDVDTKSKQLRELWGIIDRTMLERSQLIEQAPGSSNPYMRSAALLLDVYDASRQEAVDIRPYLERVTTRLLDVYDVAHLRLALDIAAVHLPGALVLPLTLIVTELVTNCCKHAFARDQEGVITIKARQDQSLQLTIMDNGAGFDTTMSYMRHGATTIASVARGAGGAITWRSDQTGTRVNLELPVPAPRSN